MEIAGLKNPIGDPPKEWCHFECMGCTKTKALSVKQRLWTADHRLLTRSKIQPEGKMQTADQG